MVRKSLFALGAGALLALGAWEARDALERRSIAEEFRKSREQYEQSRAIVDDIKRMTSDMEKSLAAHEHEGMLNLLEADGYKERFERDPSLWRALPMPEGAYRKGSGRYYKVVLDREDFSLLDGKACMRLRQDGYFDLIAVRTKAGTSYGIPGVEMNVVISPEELYEFIDGKPIGFHVMGIECSGGWKVTGSYKAEVNNPRIPEVELPRPYMAENMDIG